MYLVSRGIAFKDPLLHINDLFLFINVKYNVTDQINV